MIQLMDNLHPETIAINIFGKVSPEDYHEVSPVILGRIATMGNTPLMVRLEKVDEAAARKVWAIAKADAEHIKHFKRIAVVVDKLKHKLMVQMAAPFIPAEVKVFYLGEERAALKWLRA